MVHNFVPRRAALSIALGVFAVAGVARGGTVITLEDTAKGEGQPRAQTMYLGSDRIRFSSGDGDMLYRADQGKAYAIDAQDKSYFEMSPESAKQMRAGMDQAMARMREQMASMPEAQRKRIEAMMAKRMGNSDSADQPRISYERSGDSRKVGQWNCTPYRMLVDGKPQQELCIARSSDVGLSPDDLKAFASFGSFMGQQMSIIGARRAPMAAFDFDTMKKSIGYDGFPVQTTHLAADGKPDVSATVKSVQHKDIDPATFELPAGYTKQEMNFRAGGRTTPD